MRRRWLLFIIVALVIVIMVGCGSPPEGMAPTPTPEAAAPSGVPPPALLGAHAIVVSSDAPSSMRQAAAMVFLADGHADEVTINEAIGAAEYGLVLLVGKAFTLHGPVVVPSGITLAGAHRGVTLKIADGELGPAIRVKEEGGDAVDAFVRDLTIDGNRDNRRGADDDGISVENAFGCHIENVTIRNVPRNAIRLHQTNGSVVQGCVIALCKHGIELHDNFLKGNVVSENIVYDVSGHGIRLIAENSECDDNVIAGNILWGAQETAQPNGGVGIYAHGVGKPVAGNVITGNKILYWLDGEGTGILMDNGAYDQQIVGNFINDCQIGIRTSRYGAGGQQIASNFISYIWRNGLEIGSGDCVIEDNKILAIGRAAAHTYSSIVLYCPRNIVQGNHISWPMGQDNPLKYGIEERDNPDPGIPGPDENYITGNTIVDTDTPIVRLGPNTVVKDNFGSGCAPQSTVTPAPMLTPSRADLGITLYVHYGYELQPPYAPKAGLGTYGWNGIIGNQISVGLVTERPAAGFYASTDMETIARQLREIEQMGVKVVFLSWNGWGDLDLDGQFDGYSHARSMNQAVFNILEYAKANHPYLKFAIMIEPFWFFWVGIPVMDISSEQIQMLLDYVWENFYSPESKYADLMYRWEVDGAEKPLLMTSDPWFENYQDKEERICVRAAVFGTFDTATPTNWPAPHYLPPPSPVYDEGVVMIWPRKDEYMFDMTLGHRPLRDPLTEADRVDPFLRERLYDDAWRTIIEHQKRDDTRLVWLWSWNSWFDYVYIEPDSMTTPQSHGRTLCDKTQFYYNLFRTGQPFEYFDAARSSALR